MKKGLMISIAPLAGLPILSIVACSNNATTPNQQVATNDQQISFQDQSNFAFGNPRGFANDASFDEQWIKNKVLANKSAIFKIINEPANFDWNENLKITNLQADYENGLLEFDLNLILNPTENGQIQKSITFSNFRTPNSTIIDQDMEKALANVIEGLKLEIFKRDFHRPYASQTLIKNSFFAWSLTEPSKNFGFDVKIEPDVDKGPSISIIKNPSEFLIYGMEKGFDDQKGEKYLKITLTRGQESKTFNYTWSGFANQTDKSNNDALRLDSIKKYGGIKWFDFRSFVETTNPDAKIAEITTGEDFAKLIDLTPVDDSLNLPPERRGIYKTLLKKALPKDVKLNFSDVKPFVDLSLGKGVQAVLQLSKGSIVSSPVLVRVFGFKETALQNKENLEAEIPLFTTINSQMNDWKVLPSRIKTIEDLARCFDKTTYTGIGFFKSMINKKQITWKILEIYPETADDLETSIEAKIAFSWTDNPEIKVEKRIKFYGLGAKRIN